MAVVWKDFPQLLCILDYDNDYADKTSCMEQKLIRALL